jgi:hypothetical protein
MRVVLLALCVIGAAATAGWTLAGGDLQSMPTLMRETGATESPRGAAVHVNSWPAGAQVHIDGNSFGQTPLDIRLSPGPHTLNLQHPLAIDDESIIQVADTGTSVDRALWQRKPDVVPLRPVYPGASLLDARFLDDGQITLLVGLPSNTEAPDTSRALWRLDPATGRLSRLEIPGTNVYATTIVLAPSGDQVAYVEPSSSPPTTVSGWSTIANTSPRESVPESVWVAAIDGSTRPRRILELPSVSGPTSNPEHVVDLAWTQDGSRLVAITRQTGPPVRARLLLFDVASAVNTNIEPGATELVTLPAEVVPESAVPDASGDSISLISRAAAAPGGSSVLSLCVLELRPGGTFRDIADLGIAAPPVAAPVAWPPDTTTGTPNRLVFVAPAPPVASASSGMFGIVGALRPSAPPSGLFAADLKGSPLADAQPQRLGTAINNFGLVWGNQSTLYGFARQDDGTLALHSLDPASGAVRDLGARLPAGTAQGTTGLAARWDIRHGNALLLAHAPGVTGTASTGGWPLQAWLVSFTTPSQRPGLAH